MMGGASCKCEHCGKWFLATTIPSEHIKTCWQRRINHLEAENARLRQELSGLKEELSNMTRYADKRNTAALDLQEELESEKQYAVIVEYHEVTIRNLREQLAAAKEALETRQLDAARYRWLKDNCALGIKQNGIGWSLNTRQCVAPDCMKELDAAIDSAMKGEQP